MDKDETRKDDEYALLISVAFVIALPGQVIRFFPTNIERQQKAISIEGQNTKPDSWRKWLKDGRRKTPGTQINAQSPSKVWLRTQSIGLSKLMVLCVL
jgi:hypothetical protein